MPELLRLIERSGKLSSKIEKKLKAANRGV